MDLKSQPQIKPTRRSFLRWTLGAGALAATGLGTYATMIEPHWVEIVRREMPIRNLPAALVGKTLVQISDLHIGASVADDYMISCLASVNALSPDIVAITGDFVTAGGNEQVAHGERIMSHLKPGKLATIGIFGNHDFGHGWNNLLAADQLEARLRNCGIDILRNQVVNVAGLNIVGVDEYWSPCFEPQKVMPTLRSEAASLLLCHHPDAADESLWQGYRGWVLSGHTHGGQCNFPVLGTPMLPVRNRRYVAGAYDLGDGRTMYINRGLGHLLKARFRSRPEITVFTLRAVNG